MLLSAATGQQSIDCIVSSTLSFASRRSERRNSGAPSPRAAHPAATGRTGCGTLEAVSATALRIAAGAGARSTGGGRPPGEDMVPDRLIPRPNGEELFDGSRVRADERSSATLRAARPATSSGSSASSARRAPQRTADLGARAGTVISTMFVTAPRCRQDDPASSTSDQEPTPADRQQRQLAPDSPHGHLDRTGTEHAEAEAFEVDIQRVGVGEEHGGLAARAGHASQHPVDAEPTRGARAGSEGVVTRRLLERFFLGGTGPRHVRSGPFARRRRGAVADGRLIVARATAPDHPRPRGGGLERRPRSSGRADPHGTSVTGSRPVVSGGTATTTDHVLDEACGSSGRWGGSRR